MEELVRVARLLRETHKFGGYIHLKVIPNAAPELLAEAGRWADRLSTNIELPTDISLETLAPEKKPSEIRTAMAHIAGEARGDRGRTARSQGKRKPTKLAPAGQSTQMIVGADRRDDATILNRSGRALFRLRAEAGLLLGLLADPRCQLAAAARAAAADARAPAVPGRLADPLLWLRRARDRLGRRGRAARSGHRPEARLGAEATAARFPSTSTAPTARCCCACRGSGVRVVDRILATRRHHRLRLDDVARIAGSIDKVRPFIEAADWTPGGLTDDARLRARLTPQPEQLSLF